VPGVTAGAKGFLRPRDRHFSSFPLEALGILG